MAVLVTGGAGYIGSAFVEQLLAAGEAVVVLDDLSRGHRAAVHPGAAFYEGRTGDRDARGPHRAASTRSTPASTSPPSPTSASRSRSPARYFDNNFTQAAGRSSSRCVAAGVKRVVFSSTCATYGVPTAVPDPGEPPAVADQPLRLVEALRRAAARELRPGLRAALRGAALLQRRRRHRALPARPTTPRRTSSRSCCAAAAGRAAEVTVFGDDYDTPDGTAVRDYIHVEDLGEAHLLALAHLRRGRRVAASSTSATARATRCSR